MQNREYQTEIENAIIDYLCNEEGNPIIASPGGTGKSYIMAKLAKRLVTERDGLKIIILARDAKLLEQNMNELLNYWPGAPCGIYSSGLKMRDTKSAVIFAGIQSVAKRAHEFGKRHIIITDECDQVSPTEATQYQIFFEGIKKATPNARIIGFTATAYRLGLGCLTEMDLWDCILIDFTKTERFNYFIEEGHLCKLVHKKSALEIDVTNVGMKRGDFNEKELQEVSDTDVLNKAVVEESIRFGSDRNHWLIFASGVKHGHNLEKMFVSYGIPAVMVSAEKEMSRIVGMDDNGEPLTYAKDCEKKFRAGEIRALINVGLFQRGWNFPALDMIVWARATQSVALWVQGCVRGTRLFPGKASCLILDMAGNTRRLGPINNPIIPSPRRKGDGEKGECPVKECPNCYSYVAIQATYCPDCCFEFPPPKTIEKCAADENVMDSGKLTLPVIEDFRVLGIKYEARTSKKQTHYMRVTYSVEVTRFSEYLFFDSGNQFIRRKLQLWWTHRGGELPLPESVDEAVERAAYELTIPSMIRVDVANKYPEVVGVDFDPDAKISDKL